MRRAVLLEPHLIVSCRTLTLVPPVNHLQVSFYGLSELVNQVMPKLLQVKYGGNAQMLSLLKKRGLPLA